MGFKIFLHQVNGGYENEREKGIDRNACSSNDYINDDRLCNGRRNKGEQRYHDCVCDFSIDHTDFQRSGDCA